jgi:hypothetical protein
MGAACRDVLEGLSRHIDGETAGAERARIEAHLASCAACREEAASFRGLDCALRRAFCAHPFDRALARRIAEKAIGGGARIVRRPIFERLRIALPLAAAAALLVAAGLAIRSGVLREKGAGGARDAAIAWVRLGATGRVRVAQGAGIGAASYVVPGTEFVLRAGDRVLADGAGAEVVFRDGSRALLRADTQVELREAGLALAGPGEVYCEVAKQAPGRRFTVETPMAKAEVIGTRFGVRVESGVFSATVLDGRVRVVPQTGGEPVLLARDERVRFGLAAESRLESVSARRELAWALGREPVPEPAGGPEPPKPPARPAPTPGEPVPEPPVPRPPVDLPIGPR